jgi:hypothetical protein
MVRKLVYAKNRFVDQADRPKTRTRGTPHRREAALEARCVKWARVKGVQVAKLAECVGMPDRVFFTPGGRPLVPEFKDPGGKGKVSDAQRWHLTRLRVAGYDAPVIDSWAGFLEAMRGKGVE